MQTDKKDKIKNKKSINKIKGFNKRTVVYKRNKQLKAGRARGL